MFPEPVIGSWGRADSTPIPIHSESCLPSTVVMSRRKRCEPDSIPRGIAKDGFVRPVASTPNDPNLTGEEKSVASTVVPGFRPLIVNASGEPASTRGEFVRIAIDLRFSENSTESIRPLRTVPPDHVSVVAISRPSTMATVLPTGTGGSIVGVGVGVGVVGGVGVLDDGGVGAGMTTMFCGGLGC